MDADSRLKSIILLAISLVLLTGCLSDNANGKQLISKLLKKTEVVKKNAGMGMEIHITPSNGSSVNDIVAIKVTKPPEKTEIVAFAISGPGIPDIKKTGPNLGYDTDGKDGWGTEFDTMAYPDGKYSIYAIAGFKQSPDGTNDTEDGAPLGVAIKNVKIENAGKPSLTPPQEIRFYKGVVIPPIWQYSKDKENIKKAREIGANVVILQIVTENRNGSIILYDGWGNHIKSQINTAYRNNLSVSLSLILPAGFDKPFPYREGSDYDFPSGYDLTPLANNLEKVYEEVALFAENNDVHSITFASEIESLIGRVFENSSEYWEQSSKMDKKIIESIRNHFSGEIIGTVMGGMWGFDAPCCYTNVPVERIDFKGLDALGIVTSSDYRIVGSPLGYVDEGLRRVEFARNIANKNNVKKLYVEVGGYPLISPWKGNRTELYSEFFEKSQGKTDGYSIVDMPGMENIPYDKNAIEAAKIWYKNLTGE